MAYNRWINYSDELYHHGVKGMRWGVRKQTYSSDKRLRRWEKQYAKEQRKLVRLQGYADKDFQRKQADLYSQRSAKAKNIAVKAGITAASSLAGHVITKGVNAFIREKALTKLASLNKEFDDLMDYAYDKFEKLCKNDPQAYGPDGKWTGKGYSKEFDKAVDALKQYFDKASDKNYSDVMQKAQKDNSFEKIFTVCAQKFYLQAANLIF